MVAPTCSCVSEVQVANEAAHTVDAAVQLLAGHVRRREARQHAADYLRGLLADVERKNGWQLAECVGYAHPRGIQRVLDRYGWDAAAVRDDLRRWVVAELGDPAGILVIDETGFPKQGRHSVGVARQDCPTLGKVANCQIGVFLGYASPKGHAGIDRALFVPAEWFADRARCRQAGLPAGVSHRTKPQLARELLERALDHGVPAGWVVADEVYGSDGKLRRALEERGQAYVLAVRGNEKPSTWPPTARPARWPSPPRRGSASVVARGRKVPAAMTGPASPSARPCAPAGSTPCSFGGTRCGPTNWPTTWSMRPWRHPLRRSCAPPGPAGRSRRCSNWPRARSGSTTMRFGAGTAGTGMSPSPYSPWPR
jgi:SRSO17 transposase